MPAKRKPDKHDKGALRIWNRATGNNVSMDLAMSTSGYSGVLIRAFAREMRRIEKATQRANEDDNNEAWEDGFSEGYDNGHKEGVECSKRPARRAKR